MSENRGSQAYLSQIELDELNKMPKVYKTDNMIYRLTKKDALRIKENINPNKTQYEIINNALLKYLNERKNSLIQTDDCFNFFKDSAKNFKNSELATNENLAENFAYTVMSCALSYFYNIPHNQIGAIKNFDNAELFTMISYEELEFINRINKTLIKSGTEKPYTSEKDALNYAQTLGTSARKAFIKNYKIDPLLIEKGEYKDKDIEKFQQELSDKISSLSADAGRDEDL